MTEQSVMPTWKRLFLRSAGICAGLALTLSAVVGVLLWLSTRPKPEKPWDNGAIKAAWTNLSISTEEEKCYFNFRYSLENTTNRDYTIPSTAKVLMRLPRDMSFRDNPDLIWEPGSFIPTRQKLNIQVRIPFNYADYNFSKVKADDLKELTKFADRRLAEIDGFALFDPVNRFRVDLPNGWPDASKRVAQEDQKTN